MITSMKAERIASPTAATAIISDSDDEIRSEERKSENDCRWIQNEVNSYGFFLYKCETQSVYSTVELLARVNTVVYKTSVVHKLWRFDGIKEILSQVHFFEMVRN